MHCFLCCLGSLPITDGWQRGEGRISIEVVYCWAGPRLALFSNPLGSAFFLLFLFQWSAPSPCDALSECVGFRLKLAVSLSSLRFPFFFSARPAELWKRCKKFSSVPFAFLFLFIRKRRESSQPFWVKLEKAFPVLFCLRVCGVHTCLLKAMCCVLVVNLCPSRAEPSLVVGVPWCFVISPPLLGIGV